MATTVTKAELAAVKKELNERVTSLVTRLNTQEAQLAALQTHREPVPVELPPTPEPAPKPDLFAGTRISDFTYKEQGRPTSIFEVPDPLGQMGTGMALDVRDDEVKGMGNESTENPRAKLSAPPFVDLGDELWVRTRFMFPKGFPTLTAGGWLTLVDIYGPPSSEPAAAKLSLMNLGQGNVLGWERNASGSYAKPWTSPLLYDHWYDFLWHEKFAKTGGLVEMWLDGDQKCSLQNIPTATPGQAGGTNSVAICQYRKRGMFPEGTVYNGGLWVGTTRASVGA